MFIFPLIIIIFSAGSSYLITRTWRSPGVFFNLCWSFFLIVPLIFAPNYRIDHLALWFIAIFSMSLATGSITAYSLIASESKITRNINIYYNEKILINVLIFFSLISLIGLYSLLIYATRDL
jgi:hypothetical protein